MRLIAAAVLVVTASVGVPAWAKPDPTDIAGHWAEDRIRILLQRNIADLFPDQSFRPEDPITRAQFIKWLVLAAGLPLRTAGAGAFADVPASHPFFPYIDAAVAYGLAPRAPTFSPSLPMRRADAIVLVVTALGDVRETAALAAQPSPYDDTAALPALARGAIAAALDTDPPLLREPFALSFRPFDAMTRGEAASLIGAFVLAGEQGVQLRYTAPVGPGVNLVIEKRGLLRTLPVWRVQIGAFVTEENAQRLAASVRDRGMPVFIDVQDTFYKVRVGSFNTALEAQLARDQLAGEGFPTWVIQTLPDFEALPGPFRTAALIVDPRAGVHLAPGFGDGQRMRGTRTSEMARRTGALGAINANFFGANGDPLGCLMVAGAVVSEPDPQRTCAGFTGDGAVLFDHVRLEATVVTPDGSASLDGINRDRRTDELILYRPSFDQTTRTNAFGAEAVIRGGIVADVVDQRGNSTIPRDGYVLSGHGRGRLWILQAMHLGTPVSLSERFVPESGDPRWGRVVDAVGGGPRLLDKGLVVNGDEGFPSLLVYRRHPRTALGVLGDGRVLLLVVDGRQPPHSLGMTVLELAMEMRRLGAVDAMNLDGGGSSTMIAGGRVVNFPSDETGERPVASALLVLPGPPGPSAP